MPEKWLDYWRSIDWKATASLVTALGSLPAIRWLLGHLERRAKTREEAEEAAQVGSWARVSALQEDLVKDLRAELRRSRKEREEAEKREDLVLEQLRAVRTENGEMRVRITALEAEVKRLYRIETRCEELEAENRALREKDRARETEVLALRARVRELEAAA